MTHTSSDSILTLRARGRYVVVFGVYGHWIEGTTRSKTRTRTTMEELIRPRLGENEWGAKYEKVLFTNSKHHLLQINCISAKRCDFCLYSAILTGSFSRSRFSHFLCESYCTAVINEAPEFPRVRPMGPVSIVVVVIFRCVVHIEWVNVFPF